MSYEKAKELFLQGKSMRSISEELGYDRKKLSQQLKANGYEIKHRGLNKGTQKYNHNRDAFKIIDTEEKAYWLGFLYADGNVFRARGQIELTLSNKDISHLEAFRDFISPESPISERTVNLNGKKYLANRLNIVCMEIVNDLIALGCVENKSLVLKFPTNDIVSDNLIHHFMRGYFDGDGTCIIRNDGQVYFSVLGTEEFLTDYYNHLPQSLGFNKFQPNGNALGLQWCGNIKYPTFRDYIYKDATVYLKRKLPVPM